MHLAQVGALLAALLLAFLSTRMPEILSTPWYWITLAGMAVVVIAGLLS